MLSIFSCVYWPCICLLWRNVCLGLLLIFDWAICFFWYWGVWNSLENNPLSVASFANIFSHSEGCLLILYIVSLPCKSFIVLIRSHLELLWWFSVGMTQRARMGREEGGVFRMGNTCTPVADSCQCLAKPLQYCKVINLQLKWINLYIKKKNLQEMARVMSSIFGSGRSIWGRNGNPLQHSCLENPMDRGFWWATAHQVTESATLTPPSVHAGPVCLFLFLFPLL